VSIPRDGYVINIYGSEKKYEDRFHVGTVLRYIDNYYVYNGNPDIWQQGVIEGALSAGPRLITDGKNNGEPGSRKLHHTQKSQNIPCHAVRLV